MVLLEFQTFLIAGLLNTLRLSVAMVIGATMFAIVFAAGLSTSSWFLRRPAYLIVECVRDLPLMVTVLLIYFVLPSVGLSMNPFWSATLSVSLWGGANGAHAIRAGLLAVPNAQRETARAFGMSGWKGFFLIILPQAMPTILPPYVSLITAWVQATSLAAVIGEPELFHSAQIIIEQTTISRGGSPAFLVYGAILVVYFLLCWVVSLAGRGLERAFAKPLAADAASRIHKSNDGVDVPTVVVPADGRT